MVGDAVFVTWLGATVDGLIQALHNDNLSEVDLRRLSGGLSASVWWLTAVLAAAGLAGLALTFALHRRLARRFAILSETMRDIADDRGSAFQGKSADDSVSGVEAGLAALRLTVRSREELLRKEGERRSFDARLHRAFEMAVDEPAVLEVVCRAFDRIDGDLRAEVLMAESPRSPLERVAVSEAGSNLPPCSVSSSARCPAARSGQTRVFTDNGHLDACPQLQTKAGMRCSAACVPLSIGGQTVGVIHTRAEAGTPPGEATVSRLESIAAEMGIRVGMMRALDSSQRAASTDTLTGLLNRRSMEDRFQEMARHERPHTLVMADIDHFKGLNDNHGHDVGDRALQVFSSALRDAVRADDLVCRYGGEEFVLILPGCAAEDAAGILARIRAGLPERIAAGHVPAFTASYGVAYSNGSGDLAATMKRADGALYQAKDAGRDCTVIAGSGVVEGGPVAVDSADNESMNEQAA
ncbi:MAG: diguanylate cyclase (GGDEF)-like protein [Myxococcota bacterium]|jgi:diguanylate cyclase (GGDEF)-like protein